jgi:hypothetical protein
MSLLGQLEQRLERAVEGFFARVFRSGVHPVEIGKRLLRVMEDGKTAGLRRTYVPNVYRITLSPSDHGKLAPLESKLVEELEVFLKEAAYQRDCVLADSPSVTFLSAERLSPGEFRIDAEAVVLPPAATVHPGPADAFGQARAPTGRPHLVVTRDGKPPRTVDLDGRIRIGRQPDNDLVLDDPGVSRHHAQVLPEGQTWSVKDLGSTNGTMVNGSEVLQHRLQNGDRIVVGSTVIEFRDA